MRLSFHIAAGVVLAVALAPAAQAQRPAAADPKASAAAPKPAAPARLDEVVATVNGEKVSKEDVLRVLSNQEEIPGQQKAQYKYAVETLVNTKLLAQFLQAKKISVDEKQIDAEYNRNAAEIKQKQGSDITTVLAENNLTPARLRSEIAQYLRWKAYLMQHSSDEELAKYIERNKDLFNKSQVRASHIQANLDTDAPPAEKQKARQKLADLKKEIAAGKISFGDAADKFSQDEALVQNKSGGDLGWFDRKGPYSEPFNAAAFALKKGDVSDPVETEYGYHLIQVTDRKEGTAVDTKKLLAQFKEQILSMYALELQSQVVAEQRKSAKIDIKPMPADIFPPTPVLNVPAADAPKAVKPLR